MKTIDLDIECPACKGTGVYVGVCERDGAAVVCSKCNGRGNYRYHYKHTPSTIHIQQRSHGIKNE